MYIYIYSTARLRVISCQFLPKCKSICSRHRKKKEFPIVDKMLVADSKYFVFKIF